MSCEALVMKNKVKALVLFSGGLDSILAAMLLKERGVEVTGIVFVHPFSSSEHAVEWAGKIGIRLVRRDVDDKFFQMIREPKHGYGSNMNPCIDCRIYMLREARFYAERNGFDFIATGEVVGERPMSQVKGTIIRIEKEARMRNKIVRPLSGKLFPPTEAEENGLVEREWLLDISGRGRDRQAGLAKRFGLEDYPQPGGGCLLTDYHYSRRLAEMLDFSKRLEWSDAELLKLGRHFRVEEDKVIVGRNEEDNKRLERTARKKSLTWMEATGVGSPVTVVIPIDRRPTRQVLQKAASLTVLYSDAKRGEFLEVSVHQGKKKEILVSDAMEKNKAESLMIK